MTNTNHGNTNGKAYKKAPSKQVAAMLASLTAALRGCAPKGKLGMAGTLNKYRATYVTSVTFEGRKSLNNGDDLAGLLERCHHNDVARIAAIALGMDKEALVEKYAHLNNGQIRMNSGNRIRAAIKRGDITMVDVEQAAAEV